MSLEGNVTENNMLKDLTGKIHGVPGIDASLTKKNMSADAKATGDAIAKLQADIDKIKEHLNI